MGGCESSNSREHPEKDGHNSIPGWRTDWPDGSGLTLGGDVFERPRRVDSRGWRIGGPKHERDGLHIQIADINRWICECDLSQACQIVSIWLCVICTMRISLFVSLFFT